MRFIMIMALLGLTACAKDKSGGGKALLSTWTLKADTRAKMDLSQSSMITPSGASFTLPDLDVCVCQATILGTEDAGDFTFASCSYPNGVPAVKCNDVNQQGTYTKSGETLALCASGSCSTYF